MQGQSRAIRQDFNTAYKGVRNYFRQFKPVSTLRFVLELLHQPTNSSYDDLKKLPWQLLLLVKWICQDSMTNDKTGRDITPREFDELRQRIYDLPEITDLGTRETLPLPLFMRQLLRPQIGFQRHYSKGFVREAALLATQGENSELQRLFNERTGLSPEHFLDLSLATYTAVLSDKLVLSPHWFSPLRERYSTAVVDAFVSVISRDYDGLRAFFRALPDSNTRYASEYFEFPAIARYPLFRENDLLVFWHKMVFFRGMEGFVHTVLSEAGQNYIDRFSKLFESHVVSEAMQTPAETLYETALINLVAPNTQVPDALISYPTANIFVESKAGLFDESVMAIGHNEMFARKTRSLRKAISQGWAASSSLRQEARASKQILDAPNDFLLIVTNKDLSASKGTMLKAIYPPATLPEPDVIAQRFLPLENIYVLSIEEFERLMAAARSTEFDLPSFLRTCVEADKDPSTSAFYFEQHLESMKIPRECSALVNDALAAAGKRLETALQAT